LLGEHRIDELAEADIPEAFETLKLAVPEVAVSGIVEKKLPADADRNVLVPGEVELKRGPLGNTPAFRAGGLSQEDASRFGVASAANCDPLHIPAIFGIEVPPSVVDQPRARRPRTPARHLVCPIEPGLGVLLVRIR